MKKIVKFGGSSLADATQFKKVAKIIKSDESRRFVVPSAPGKRFSEDIKVTDLLYQAYNAKDNKTNDTFGYNCHKNIHPFQCILHGNEG